jgi:hypothetical protein
MDTRLECIQIGGVEQRQKRIDPSSWFGDLAVSTGHVQNTGREEGNYGKK